jgi:hypothetical protein
MQYSNFKDTLQNIASQIGNVEQEVEEHKYVTLSLFLMMRSLRFWVVRSPHRLRCYSITTNTVFRLCNNHERMRPLFLGGHGQKPSAYDYANWISLWARFLPQFSATIPPGTGTSIRRIYVARTTFFEKARARLDKVVTSQKNTDLPIQTRPRYPHTPPNLTQMLPHDQRRSCRAHRR